MKLLYPKQEEGIVDGLRSVPGLGIWATKTGKHLIQLPRNLEYIEPALRQRLVGAPFKLDVPQSHTTSIDFSRIHGLQLYGYQTAGVERMLSQGGSGHLWWACGTGKTIAGIVWAEQWEGDTIILCRKNNIYGYRRTYQRFCDSRPYCLIEENKEPFDDYLLRVKDRRVLITTWAALPRVLKEFAPRMRLKTGSVVFDEIHIAKDYRRYCSVMQPDGQTVWVGKGNTSYHAEQLSRLVPYRLATSATPLANVRIDLWSPLDLIHPDEWGTWAQFAKRYCNAYMGEYGLIVRDRERGYSCTNELNKRLDQVVHRVSDAEAKADLPPVYWEVVFIPGELQNRAMSFATELKMSAKLKNHKAYALEVGLMMAASRKLRWLVDRAQEAVDSRQKWVFFCGRRQEAERLRDELQGTYKDVPVWLVHSEHGTMQQHQEWVEAYGNAPGAAFFVGTWQSIGESLDGLQCSHCLVFTRLPYTPREIEQGIGRGDRIGRTHALRVLIPVAEGTKDDHVVSILLPKTEDVTDIVSGTRLTSFADKLAGMDDQEAADLFISSLAKVEDDDGN